MLPALASRHLCAVSPSVLQEVQSYYNQGLFLQAYHLLSQSKPLQECTANVEEQLLAGRLAYRLGAPRLGQAMHLRAGRRYPQVAEAAYYRTWVMWERQGPLRAWERLQHHPDPQGWTTTQRADLLCLEASILGSLRDFDRAEDCLQAAQALEPTLGWLWLTKARILEQQDEYEAALATVEQALVYQPNLAASVGMAAHLLTLLDRPEQALVRLEESLVHLESADLAWQLGNLQMEHEAYPEAAATYQRYTELSPLLEPRLQQRLWAVQADLAYALGDCESAIHFAQQVNVPFYHAVAERLTQLTVAPLRKPVILPVRFIRQHHMTCAPATLAMLTHYWQKPVDHLAIAAAICYEGTSQRDQRTWAEQQGYCVREFRLTWESAVALIDREIPIAVSTVETNSAHMQVVIGYDPNLQQLLIRDPYIPSLGRVWAPEFLKTYAVFGPRAMVLVPQLESAKLEGLDLPEALQYDALYQLDLALEHHQRDQALAHFKTLRDLDPEHRLTYLGQQALHRYDGDLPQLLMSTNALLAQFPESSPLLRIKLDYLQELSYKQERLDLLAQICASPQSEPYFWQVYAYEVSDDHRCAQQASQLLRRAIHAHPREAENYYVLANLLWGQQEFTSAFALYRFATCLSIADYRYAQSYFLAARHFRQTDTALQFLERRWQRFGDKSSEPALTLFWALTQLDQTIRAFKLLKQACQQRPHDGDLWLSTAKAYADFGQIQPARAVLKQAKGKTSRLNWLRAAAHVTQLQGNSAKAIQCWQQVLDITPLDIKAIRALAQLLADTQAPQVGLEFLSQACQRFPHSFTLHQIYLNWLEEQNVPSAIETAIQVARHLIEIDPHHAWPHRRLVTLLTQQQDFDAAFATLEVARHLEPHHLGLYYVWGELVVKTGDLDQARSIYHQAIQQSVDADWAIVNLLDCCKNLNQRRLALADIYQELVRQVCFGDGLLAYQAAAVAILEPTELQQQLMEAYQMRPDLWQAWSALIQQHLHVEETETALALGLTYTQRFPLLPRAWLDLADIYRQQRDSDGEERSLKQGLTISPDWGLALQRLSDLYQRTQRLDAAATLLQAAIARSPRNVSNYGNLAQLYGQQRRYDQAIVILTQALEINSSYPWAWSMLQRYSQEINQPEHAENLARKFIQQYPQDAQHWLQLAEILEQPQHLPERLQALDQALKLNPYLVNAYDLKAILLGESEQFADAIAACEVNIGGDPPVKLQLRRAWLEKIQGNIAEALRRVRVVLKQNPQITWGWFLMAQLTSDIGDAQGFLEATQQLTRLEPEVSDYWRFLGRAYNWLQDAPKAALAYQRAIDCSPAATTPGLTLFDYQFQEKHLEAATATFAQISPYLTSTEGSYCQIALAILQQDGAQASHGLLQLCQQLETQSGSQADNPSADPQQYELLTKGIAAMQGAGWETEVAALLHPFAHQAQPSIPLVQAWLQVTANAGEWQGCETYLAQQPLPRQVQIAAYCAYLEAIATPRYDQVALKFINKHRRMLKSTTELWGYTGNTLRKIRAYPQARQWFQDWSRRPTAQAWMLLNLNEVYRIGPWGYDITKALEISKAALHKQDDGSLLQHHGWQYYDLATLRTEHIDGLYAIDAFSEYPEYLCLRYLTQALLTLNGFVGSRQMRRQLLDRYLDRALAAYPGIQSDKPFFQAYCLVTWRCFETTGHVAYFKRWIQAAFLHQISVPQINLKPSTGLDFQTALDACKNSFGAAPRRLPWQDQGYLCPSRPLWAWIGRDPLKLFFQKRRYLLRHGFVTWGVIIQANNALFYPNPGDCPAEVLYCADPLLQIQPQALHEIARDIFRLKNTTPEESELADFAAMITDEYNRHFGQPVPQQLSPDLPTEISVIQVIRQHLPNGYLSRGYFPLLVSPTDPKIAMILPSRYWGEAMIEWWLAEE
jgi:cellulose synthase operon protein C